MNKHTPLKISGSLLERAAELYDFRKDLRGPAHPETPEREQGEVREPEPAVPAPAPAPAAEVGHAAEPASEAPRRRKQPIIMSQVEVTIEAPHANDIMESEASASAAADAEFSPGAPEAIAPSRRGSVNLEALKEAGFILPNAPVTALAEEFRIIKRQLLQAAAGRSGLSEHKRQTILVCSATPDEGKTFCAVNLALSVASEEDVEVLLVDGDFAKPEIPAMLGLPGGPGLIDAIADPAADPNAFIIRTDVDRLSILPAGRKVNNIPELLASERTRHVLRALTEGHPRRIVIFDSPPTLLASPASILADSVGQVVVVVRADKTTEADLREAVGLLSGCENVSLMLNGAGFGTTNRRFGSYYGYGQ